MRLALSMAEAESPPGGLVLLSDSKAALTQLANLDRASPLGRVRELGDTDAAPRLDPGLPVAARPLRHRRKQSSGPLGPLGSGSPCILIPSDKARFVATAWASA
ncbi:uncharacterized protein ISCGN_023072 [Ixodes scapularis]